MLYLNELDYEVYDLIADFVGAPGLYSGDKNWFFETKCKDMASIDSADGTINYLVYTNTDQINSKKYIFGYLESLLIDINYYHFKISGSGLSDNYEAIIGIINDDFDAKSKLGHDTTGSSIGIVMQPQECFIMYKNIKNTSSKMNINKLNDLNSKNAFFSIKLNKTARVLTIYSMDLECVNQQLTFNIPNDYNLINSRFGVNLFVGSSSCVSVGVLY